MSDNALHCDVDALSEIDLMKAVHRANSLFQHEPKGDPATRDMAIKKAKDHLRRVSIGAAEERDYQELRHYLCHVHTILFRDTGETFGLLGDE